ncbi:MAG: hypothetical protein CO133_02610, partial [Candidatus Komeilibacteria bacterium CG_4_9_14_3_um_filter_37_5]
KILSRKTSKKENNTEVGDDFFSTVASKQKIKEKQPEENWLEEEEYDGQLSVDVFENNNCIVIKLTIAGVKPEDVDISINNEMVTIKGRRRQEEEVAAENYYYQECYWGGFSRSIILPTEIQPEKVEATLKNGVLKVVLPKAIQSKEVSIRVKGDE